MVARLEHNLCSCSNTPPLLLLSADMPRSKPLWGRFVGEPDGGISLYLITVWRQEGYLQHWTQVGAACISLRGPCLAPVHPTRRTAQPQEQQGC